MGRSGGLGMTKTGKCLTDDNFFEKIHFLCPYNSLFNRQVFNFIFGHFSLREIAVDGQRPIWNFFVEIERRIVPFNIRRSEISMFPERGEKIFRAPPWLFSEFSSTTTTISKDVKKIENLFRKNIEIFVQRQIIPSLHYMVDLINK